MQDPPLHPILPEAAHSFSGVTHVDWLSITKTLKPIYNPMLCAYIVIDVKSFNLKRMLLRLNTILSSPEINQDILNVKLTGSLLVGQGKGFHLVRGLPVEQFKADRVGLVLAFWSLALHLGRPLVRHPTRDPGA